MADIWINILGDASKLKGELDKAGKNVTSFSEKIGKIGKIATIAGAAITGAFTAIVLKTAATGDQFDKMSLRTGVAVEDLSSLAYAADICGTDIGTVENSLRFLTSGIKDAADGTGTAKDAFEELGISVIDSEGNLKSTVEVMKEAATKLAEMGDKTRQAALAGEIFGTRYGTQLLPMLKAGGDGIEELMQKAKDLNIVVSTEAATAAAEFTDRMTELKGSLGAAGREIGDALIPALTPLVEKITEIVGKVVTWAKENPELVTSIIKVVAVIGAAAAVGGPILMAATAFSGIATAIGLICSPIGLVIAAVAGLAIAWKTNFMGIQDKTKAVIEFLKGLFANFVKFISESFNRLMKVIDAVKKAIASIKDISIKGITIGPVTPEGFGIGGTSVPSYQEGIAFVPRKAFYGLDPGERVLTAKENINYNQSKREINININNPVVRNDGDIAKIKQQVEKGYFELIRQYGRGGYELPV